LATPLKNIAIGRIDTTNRERIAPAHISCHSPKRGKSIRAFVGISHFRPVVASYGVGPLG
jgi:hypothetical protein